MKCKLLFCCAALSLLFSACDKEDTVNTGFRTPDCADTLDDGRFELFNAPETSRFLNFYKEVPETEKTLALAFQYLDGKKLVNTAIDYLPVFRYKALEPVAVYGYFAYGDNQYYSWTRTAFPGSDTSFIPIYNVRNLNLQPGCYRFYYVVSDTGLKKVFTKGHYDLEIKTF
jgi:hypothetical protein